MGKFGSHNPLALLDTTEDQTLFVYSPHPLKQSLHERNKLSHYWPSLQVDINRSIAPAVEYPSAPVTPSSVPIVSGQKYIYRTHSFPTETFVANRRNAKHDMTYFQEGVTPSTLSSFTQCAPQPVLASHPILTVYPAPLPLDKFLHVFSVISHQLHSLDSTYRTHREVYLQMRGLCEESGPYPVIPAIILCVLEKGVSWGFPYNKEIATFFGYFLRRLFKDLERQGHLAEITALSDLARRTFTFTFNQWWTPVRLEFSFTCFHPDTFSLAS